MDIKRAIEGAGYAVIERVDGAYPQRMTCVPGTAGVGAGCERVEIQVLRCASGESGEQDALSAYAERLERLEHPSIVRYLGHFEITEGTETAICLVHEHTPGVTLGQLLDEHPQGIGWKAVKEIFGQCLDALRCAAGNGVVHGRLHPACVIVGLHQTVKLTGFCHPVCAATRAGAAWESAPWTYRAPECVIEPGFCGDERSDIFSFGVCLYEALTGNAPFDISDEADCHAHWTAKSPEQPVFGVGILRVLAQSRAFLSAVLAADHAERFQTFDEVSAQFDGIHPRVLELGAGQDCELVEFIGRGGFGDVFKARRVQDGKIVAVKRLTLHGGAQRFRREAAILQKNPHPNLVAYEGFFEASRAFGERECFLVLEFLPGMPGCSLRDRINQAPAGLDVEETLRLFVAYLEALRHLHHNDIIHRDIKPGNLYAPFDDPGRAKIFDLGIARSLSGTQTVGLVPGTWDYMPPEYFDRQGERGSPRSDIYALGLCIFEALTGKPAFPRLSKSHNEAMAELGRRVRGEQIIDYAHPVLRGHPLVVALIKRCTQKDPKDRFPDADAMLTALHACLDALARLKHAGDADDADERESMVFYTAATTGSRVDATVKTVPLKTLAGAGKGDNRKVSTNTPSVRRNGVWIKGLAACFVAAGMIVVGLRLNLDVSETHKNPGAWGKALRNRWPSPPAAAEPTLGDTQALAEDLREGAQTPERGGEIDEPAPMDSVPMDDFSDHQAIAEATTKLVDTDMYDYRGAVAGIRKALEMGAGPVEAQLAAWESTDAQFKALMHHDWSGVGEEEKRSVLEELELMLKGNVVAYINTVKREAENALASGNSEREWELKLERLANQTPFLFGLTSNLVRSTQNDLNAQDQERATFESRMEAISLKLIGESGFEPTPRHIENGLVEAKGVEDQRWSVVRDEEKTERLNHLRMIARGNLVNGLTNLQAAAVHDIEAGGDGGKPRQALEVIRDRLPYAAALVDEELTDALVNVSAARVRVARDRLLEAIRSGVQDIEDGYYPEDIRPLIFQTLQAAVGVRGGLDVSGLLMSDRVIAGFMAPVGLLWQNASVLQETFGPMILEEAWNIIHSQLAADVRRTLEGEIRLRPPAQQATVRRRFLDVLRRVETLTQRISTCAPDDSLRRSIEQYFDVPYYPDLIFSQVALDGEQGWAIAWLASEMHTRGLLKTAE